MVTDTYDHTVQLVMQTEAGETVAIAGRGKTGVQLDLAGLGILRSCLEKWDPGYFKAKSRTER